MSKAKNKGNKTAKAKRQQKKIFGVTTRSRTANLNQMLARSASANEGDGDRLQTSSADLINLTA